MPIAAGTPKTENLYNSESTAVLMPCLKIDHRHIFYIRKHEHSITEYPWSIEMGCRLDIHPRVV